MGKAALSTHLVVGISPRRTEYLIFIYLPCNLYTKGGVSQFGITPCFPVKTFSNSVAQEQSVP